VCESPGRGFLFWRAVAADSAAADEGQNVTTDALVILHVEDDPGHAALVRRHLERAGIAGEIVHVADGQEALDFVHCRDKFAERSQRGPLLLLLDIKMPRMDGVEVLRRLKGSYETTNLPIIMLTTTDDPREIQRCYELGCSVYITKPVSYDDFVKATTRLGLFLSIVKVPHQDEPRNLS
jgi:CheY-like chemotaxis protein